MTERDLIFFSLKITFRQQREGEIGLKNIISSPKLCVISAIYIVSKWEDMRNKHCGLLNSKGIGKSDFSNMVRSPRANQTVPVGTVGTAVPAGDGTSLNLPWHHGIIY